MTSSIDVSSNQFLSVKKKKVTQNVIIDICERVYLLPSLSWLNVATKIISSHRYTDKQKLNNCQL